MESTKTQGGKKKGLSFVSITSTETKFALIKRINNIVENYTQQEKLEIGQIPLSPVPNISFWIKDDEKKCGLTINRENCKWGWSYLLSENAWKPCSYMAGMGFDKIEFGQDENDYLTRVMVDHCVKYPWPREIRDTLGLN